MLKSRSSNQRGATLIEIVIVAGVLIMIMTAVVNLMVASLSRNRVAKERAVATRLSQEAAEWIKNEHARLGWIDFSSRITDGTAFDDTYNICLQTIPTDGTSPLASASVGSECDCNSEFVQIDASDSKYCRNIQIDYDPSVPRAAYTISTRWDDQDPILVEGVIFRRAR